MPITSEKSLPSAEFFNVAEGSKALMATVSDFADFSRTHHTELLAASQEGEEALCNYIYHAYYGKPDATPKYSQENGVDMTVMAAQYDDEVLKTYTEIYNRITTKTSETPANLQISHGEYWVYANSNERLKSSKPDKHPIGRFYLNIKPMEVADIFEKITDALSQTNLEFQVKIPRLGNEHAFNRPDKLVLYFDGQQTKEILRIIDEIYNRNKEAFDSGTPKWTQQVADVKREAPMSGIAFGQEPPVSGTSFGLLRSKIFGQFFLFSEQNHTPLDGRKAVEALKQICNEEGLSAEHPTYNRSAIESGLFDELIRREYTGPAVASPEFLRNQRFKETIALLQTERSALYEHYNSIDRSLTTLERNTTVADAQVLAEKVEQFFQEHPKALLAARLASTALVQYLGPNLTAADERLAAEAALHTSQYMLNRLTSLMQPAKS